MNKKPRLSAKPPTQSEQDFIEAAEKPLQSPPSVEEVRSSEPLPWEEDNVRDDVIKSINLRLSEPYILKLQFLSEKTNKSQQRLIREVLCPALDKEIEKLLGEEQ
ncbi:hypothetical protein VB715_19360 [Crocosphaera sp. UHCC 0190]|uniref:hypothetical protein n=1 Tax=unclassified Crocosphaera TaxID=2623705 RepID=UPI002B1FCCCB|nr:MULTISPECIES: hypothetical protein [unclassified Crocosphaera]MEA5511936.1 hypothetical protein [Crocosphaera sp. UHCC 0190]MEA5536655.1 hypothetical protein [Crocosphaera sp. XPORK-15E]